MKEAKLARSSTEELKQEMENRDEQKELAAGKWVLMEKAGEFNGPKYKAMNPKTNEEVIVYGGKTDKDVWSTWKSGTRGPCPEWAQKQCPWLAEQATNKQKGKGKRGAGAGSKSGAAKKAKTPTRRSERSSNTGSAKQHQQQADEEEEDETETQVYQQEDDEDIDEKINSLQATMESYHDKKFEDLQKDVDTIKVDVKQILLVQVGNFPRMFLHMLTLTHAFFRTLAKLVKSCKRRTRRLTPSRTCSS
jgi:hypothetical protein